jgi:pimeloyl-ACP methyl ester carboxylesterase
LHVSISSDLSTSILPIVVDRTDAVIKGAFHDSTKVEVQLYDSQNRLVNPGLYLSDELPVRPNPSTDRLIYNTAGTLPPDTYHLVLTAKNTDGWQYSPTVTISGGNNWKAVTRPGNSKAHHVGVYPATVGAHITSGKPTWVVIHGRTSSPTSFPGLRGIESALLAAPPIPPQVLVVDWETAAWDNYDALGNDPQALIPLLSGRVWIKQVGDFAARVLTGTPIPSNSINLVGHSWGSYIAEQIARDLSLSSGKVNGLVALDPALVGADATDDSLNVNAVLPFYFGARAKTSWAFYSSPLGSYANALTAQSSFVVLNPYEAFDFNTVDKLIQSGKEALFNQPIAVNAHEVAASAFAKMILRNNTPNQHLGNAIIWKNFAVWPMFSLWMQQPFQNQVLCYSGGGPGVVPSAASLDLRSATDLDPSHIANHPLEALLQVDDKGEPIMMWTLKRPGN